MSSQALNVENALHGLDEFLRDKIAPAIADPYVAPMARLSGMLLRICANGVDDAVELRVEENAAIREILGEAAHLFAKPLSDQLRATGKSIDPGLKISVLDAENDRLRRLLVEAHAALEARADPAASALDQQIWCLLEKMEAMRAPREQAVRPDGR
ncbi:MAG: hypothetical protein KA199_09940 [Sphingorhabdus sp.]|nr:hypothetical protein [Sphingorhabdus sp.]